MIIPDTSSLREEDLPDSAIDYMTYPPYRLVWCLEIFRKTDDLIDATVVLKNFDVAALRRLFRRPPSDPMILGGWPVTGKYQQAVEVMTGQRLKLARYSYFIAAVALNHNEVDNSDV